MSPYSEILTLYTHQEIDEEIETPNAMYISTLDNGSVTLDMFIQSLPSAMFDKGTYSFRFKAYDDVYGYVWRDISLKNNQEKLPLFDGIICAKILNLNVKSVKDNNNRIKIKIKKSKLSSNNINNNNIKHNNNNNDSIKSNDHDNELNFYANDNISNSSNSNCDFEGNVNFNVDISVDDDLVDVFSSSNISSSSISNFMEVGSPSATSTALSTASTAVPASTEPQAPLDRAELAAARKAAVDDKVKEALEFKLELDANAKKEAEELESAKNQHDKQLSEWAASNNEKRNIRTLLTTMQNVLWPNNKWKTVTLGDVIDSRKVKLTYRKAMLVVHPDRCSNATAEVRFIAKRIFEAINEAYQEFLTKEGLE